MSKKIIWALFDDGYGSWHNLQNELEDYTIISIGINENPNGENYYKIDLRLSNFYLVKQLSQLPKPDIIVASPPCESGSHAGVASRCFICNNENSIKIHNEDFYLLNNRKVKRFYENQQRKRIIGEDTALATSFIIEKFKPNNWVIENPVTSKIWGYLNCFGQKIVKMGIKNTACYNCYDNMFSKKRTIFLSNKILNLKKYHVKGAGTQERKSIVGIGFNYDERSAIPKSLLLDIINLIEKDETQLKLFGKGDK